jgi:uncharacterized protein YkwD
MPDRMRLKLILLPLAALLTFAALAAGAPDSAQAGCHKSGKAVKNISKQTARNAMVCLFNKGRSARNLRRVAGLKSSAQYHSGVMASRECFAHQCPGEPSLKERVARTGYLRGAEGYGLGEIIICQPASASPRRLVRLWMNSSGHRSVIQKSSFNHVGVGLSIRNGFVWSTADFGHR